jgi:hypothetical protein
MSAWMPEWWILLAPLLMFIVSLTLAFVGCVGDDPTSTPSPPSRLKLNMDAGLQDPTPADSRKVKEIKVSWTLFSLGSPSKTVPAPPADILPTDATDDFLDPLRDPGAEYTVNDPADLSTTDQVRCTCEVRQGIAGDDAADDTVAVSSGLVPFATNTVYVFSLMQKPPTSSLSKHVFVLQEYTPT